LKYGYFRHIGDDQIFQDNNNLYTAKSHILNLGIPYSQSNKTPVQLSSHLLTLISAIYNVHGPLVKKYGALALQTISLTPDYEEFASNAMELHNVNLLKLTEKQRTIFFINIYNTLVLHASITKYLPSTMLTKIEFCKTGILLYFYVVIVKALYNIGGNIYNLYDIDHATLRAKSSKPSSFGSSLILPKFKKSDPRYAFRILQPHPLINFALNQITIDSPPIRVYHEEDFDAKLLTNTKKFLDENLIISWRKAATKKKITIPKILDWFMKDFAPDERKLITEITTYLSTAKKAELEETLGVDPHPKIMFKAYDWDFKFPEFYE